MAPINWSAERLASHVVIANESAPLVLVPCRVSRLLLLTTPVTGPVTSPKLMTPVTLDPLWLNWIARGNTVPTG